MSKLSNIDERKLRAEEYHFRKFLSLNEDLNDCNEPDPGGARAPDRVILLRGKRIGIELTRYYVDSFKSPVGGSPMKQEEDNWNKLVRAAQMQFEKAESLSLRIDFMKDNSFRFIDGEIRKQRDTVVKNICNLVRAWAALGSSKMYLRYRELLP